ncbi:nucleotide exchange factor GrpE [Planomonospora algeriensis]
MNHLPPDAPAHPGPETDPETDGRPPDPLTERLTERLAELAAQVGREHERAAHREQIIDRLHAENQELRRGLLEEALTPVRAGLYRLYDLVGREAARHARSPEPPSAEHVGALLEAVAEEVAEVLARTGAERMEVLSGDAYDPAVHRPLHTEPGPDGRVTRVLSDGFIRGERVLRKAGVAVGRPAPGEEGKASRGEED